MKTIATTMVAAGMVFALSTEVRIEPLSTSSGLAGLSLSFAPAIAVTRGEVRRTSRRTSRRTTRRVVRRTTLPAGCAFRAPYYYCGGVYYQPIVESGTTVYIVVNP